MIVEEINVGLRITYVFYVHINNSVSNHSLTKENTNCPCVLGNKGQEIATELI